MLNLMLNIKNKRWFYTVTFFSLAIILCMAFTVNVTQNILDKDKNAKDDADFFMRNVEYTQFNEQGKVQTQIQTPYIVHYQQSKTYTFDKPILLIHSTDNKLWHISSNQGIGRNDGVEIVLTQKVNLNQYSSDDIVAQQPLIKVLTEQANIFPHENLAYTTQPLTITQTGMTVNAVGAKVDLQTSIIKLLSQVQGQTTK